MNNSSNLFGTYPAVFNPLPNVQTFGYDPKSMFVNHNFINDGNLRHNNLAKILLNEEIREYSVLIDSKDRNYQVYPNPFQYDVRFSPLPKSKTIINGKTITYEDPNPTINDSFSNVRYIKLEVAILPFYNYITKISEDSCDGDTVETTSINTLRPLTDNLYIVLSLGDYSDINYRSTNDVLSDSFAVIYCDKLLNNTHYLGYTYNGIKIFQQDQLAKIDKLRISFMDPYGNKLSCNHLNKNIKSNLECNCIDPCGDDDSNCFKHNLYHPLNPIFQHHLHFKVGVVEPRLKKLTFN